MAVDDSDYSAALMGVGRGGAGTRAEETGHERAEPFFPESTHWRFSGRTSAMAVGSED